MATYKEYDKNGRLISTITGVLSPVVLTGVVTTTGSNRITVDSTTGVYPGMPIACPNVPSTAFVLGVVSGTVLALAASAYSATGVWTTTEANANATVASSPESDLTAYAYGFSHACILATVIPMGTWRNTIRTQLSTNGTVAAATGGVANSPAFLTGVTIAGGVTTYAGTILSDEASATPLKRHNGEFWGVRPVVSTAGALNLIPANNQNRIVLSA